MWFNYRKTPLGTAVRESMATILGMYMSKEDAEKDMENLKEVLSANLKIVNLDVDESYERACVLDPDIADVYIQNKKKYLLVAVWSEIEP